MKEELFFNKRYNATPNVWLYNLEKDPLEKHNQFFAEPEIVRDLLKRLKTYSKTAVPPQNSQYDKNWSPKWNYRFALPWKGAKNNITLELLRQISTSEHYGKLMARRR